jgi:HlyD family secretion protein
VIDTQRKWWVGGGIAVVLLAVTATLAFRGADGPQYFGAAVEHGDIRDVVDLTGTVNAVVTVQVGSQVSGTIARLDADFNTRVHRGQIIAVIDSSILHGALLQATADLESAKANLAAAEANVTKSRASADQSKRDYDRVAALAKSRVVSDQDVEQARAAEATAHASVDAAVAGVEQARAEVSQKTAAVAVARTNLDHTIIRSPIDGIVVARNVDVGQTVAASLQAPTIFTIAQDLTKMQLYAKTQESDVGRIKLGQPATFKVDAFPKETFKGTVSQIRMNPTMIQNVVTYDAIIDFANPELKLFPGMTAYATIPVASVQDVDKVPNAALRYKPPLPPEQLRALQAKAGVGGNVDVTQAGAATPPRETAVVWKLNPDHTIAPVEIALGLTDHAFTQVSSVLAGSIKPGEQVVTGALVSKAPPGPQAVRK